MKPITRINPSLADVIDQIGLLITHEYVPTDVVLSPFDHCFHEPDAETVEMKDSNCWSAPWSEVNSMRCFCCGKYIKIKNEDGSYVNAL